MAFGTDPFGGTVFGLFAPTVGATYPRTTGPRFIDPATGDYVLDSSGQPQRMPSTRQRVLIALKQLLNSGPDGLGLKVPSRITSQFQAEMNVAVERALAHLTRTPDPTISDLVVSVVSTDGGRALTGVIYTDNVTGLRDGARF